MKNPLCLNNKSSGSRAVESGVVTGIQVTLEQSGKYQIGLVTIETHLD